MTRRKISDQTEDRIQADPNATPAAEDDTEGHSIGLLLGMMALDEANHASDRERARIRARADVPPLTKSWPNLRAEAAAAAAAAASAEATEEGASSPALGNRPLPAPSTS